MSITASYIALVVILVRLLLKKVPKIFSYTLWAVVLFRLVFPFTFSSQVSILNIVNSQSYIPHYIGIVQPNTINSSINSTNIRVNNPDTSVITDPANNVANSSVTSETPPSSANSVEIMMNILSYIWIIIAGILLIYSVVQYLKIKSMVKHATLVNDNIYETDRISTPFVLGFIRPKIYIPLHIKHDEFLYVIHHEIAHIKRKDHLIKFFAFLVLILHWFNPLMWVCYALMTKDMEMSCDESAMKYFYWDIGEDYSKLLLSLSTKRSGLLSPLAFGESNVKSRIKNILNYRAPTLLMKVFASVLILTLAVSLISNSIKPASAGPAINEDNRYGIYKVAQDNGYINAYNKSSSHSSIELKVNEIFSDQCSTYVRIEVYGQFPIANDDDYIGSDGKNIIGKPIPDSSRNGVASKIEEAVLSDSDGNRWSYKLQTPSQSSGGGSFVTNPTLQALGVKNNEAILIFYGAPQKTSTSFTFDVKFKGVEGNFIIDNLDARIIPVIVRDVSNMNLFIEYPHTKGKILSIKYTAFQTKFTIEWDIQAQTVQDSLDYGDNYIYYYNGDPQKQGFPFFLTHLSGDDLMHPDKNIITESEASYALPADKELKIDLYLKSTRKFEKNIITISAINKD